MKMTRPAFIDCRPPAQERDRKSARGRNSLEASNPAFRQSSSVDSVKPRVGSGRLKRNPSCGSPKKYRLCTNPTPAGGGVPRIDVEKRTPGCEMSGKPCT